MSAFRCQSCGAPVTLAAPIPRDAECDACRHDLRCCRNCRHFDTRYNNACKETEAEPVADKERRNFCEYFDLNPAHFAGAPGAPSPGANRTHADDARAKLDALFKKKPGSA
jgi:hypothetical protein